MTSHKIKISIVDDHPVVLQGLRSMLTNHQDITIISEYSTGEELLKGLTKKQPDVLLLDIKIPDITGDELAQVITAKYPTVKILVLTYLESIYYTKLMIRRGAMGYITKSSGPERLISAIQTVYRGEQYLEEDTKKIVLEQALLNKRNKSSSILLTKREKEVLQLLSSNYNSRQIAEKLFLSKRTVENHRANLLLKLNVSNAPSLIKKAMELNLLD